MEGDNRWLIGDGDSGRAMKGRPLPHSRLIGEGDTTIVSQARLAREPWPATCHNNVSFFTSVCRSCQCQVRGPCHTSYLNGSPEIKSLVFPLWVSPVSLPCLCRSSPILNWQRSSRSYLAEPLRYNLLMITG